MSVYENGPSVNIVIAAYYLDAAADRAHGVEQRFIARAEAEKQLRASRD